MTEMYWSDKKKKVKLCMIKEKREQEKRREIG